MTVLVKALKLKYSRINYSLFTLVFIHTIP